MVYWFLGQLLLPNKDERRYVQATKTICIREDSVRQRYFRWQIKWLHSSGDSPATLQPLWLNWILDYTYTSLKLNVNVIHTMSVSTATPECSLSAMRRLKTYLHATIKTEWLSTPTLIASCIQGYGYWKGLPMPQKNTLLDFHGTCNGPFQLEIKSSLVTEKFKAWGFFIKYKVLYLICTSHPENLY